jgi:hypothetical protein
MKKIMLTGGEAKARLKEILKDRSGLSTFEIAVLTIVGVLVAILFFMIATGLMEDVIAPGLQERIENLFGRTS